MSKDNPNLVDVGRRLTEEWMARWHLNPPALRNDVTMPGLLHADTDAGRQQAAASMAAESVETIQTLLAWIESQEVYQKHAPVVRHSLVKALTQAGRAKEAPENLTCRALDAGAC